MIMKMVEKYTPSGSYHNLRDQLTRHIEQRFSQCFLESAKKRAEIQTKEAFCVYQESLRKQFIDACGGLPYDKDLPLNAVTVKTTEEEHFIIENILYESRPGVHVPGTLYLPKKRKNPCGAVLFQCGHADNGRLYSVYQQVARIIASCGLIVLMIDCYGQGERRAYYDETVSDYMIYGACPEHQFDGNRCILTGDSPVRYFIADAMRGVDYLISRPEVDADKIGATGSSGGGTMTTNLMICDPRIKAAAPGTFLTTKHDILSSGTAQDTEQIWLDSNLYGFDHFEALLCFCPKPLMILAVDSDFFPLNGTKELYQETKRFWQLSGQENNLQLVTDQSTHRYTPALARAAGSFFAEALNTEACTAGECGTPLSEEALFSAPNGQTCLLPNENTLFSENLARFTEKPTTDKAWLKEKIFHNREPVDFCLRYPTGFAFSGLGVKPAVWFSQKDLLNYGVFFSLASNPDKKKITVCLWDKGTNAITDHATQIRALCEAGKTVLILDTTGTGKCLPLDTNPDFEPFSEYGILDFCNKNLWTLGDSLCAMRCYDILRTIELLRKEGYVEIELLAEGHSAVYAELTADLDTQVSICTQNPYRLLDIVEKKYYENYDISALTMPGLALYQNISKKLL